jgi:hypothetical protein
MAGVAMAQTKTTTSKILIKPFFIGISFRFSSPDHMNLIEPPVSLR